MQSPGRPRCAAGPGGRRPEHRPPTPAPRAPQPAADRLRALQRTAGNAAVARVLQRKVGFELEADLWHSWRRTKPMPPSEASKPPAQRILPPDAYEPMRKKDVIHRGTGYTLEADETSLDDRAGRKASDIEFVTVPFEESPEGLAQLARTMATIALVAEAMTRMPQADEAKGRFNHFEDLTAAGLDPPAGTMLDFGDRPMTFKVQSTFGLPLDQVARFMASMGSGQPGESRSKRRARRAGRELMQQRGGIDPPGMMTLGKAAAEAERACAVFARSTGTPASAELKGLLSLVTLYVLMGDRYAAGASYPKAIAALMARTDFAQLFKLLPRAERRRLQQEDNKYWHALVANATRLPLNVPVMKGARALQAVTRKLWLDEMVEGVDVLSQAGYLALAGKRHPDATSKEHQDMAAEASSLESMGAMGGATEGRDAAIFELRAIPKMIPHTEVPAIAARLAEYVAALNRHEDASY